MKLVLLFSDEKLPIMPFSMKALNFDPEQISLRSKYERNIIMWVFKPQVIISVSSLTSVLKKLSP